MKTFDQLSEVEQHDLIKKAFDYLCDQGQVPYGVLTGDDATWDEYEPAIELAIEWYENA